MLLFLGLRESFLACGADSSMEDSAINPAQVLALMRALLPADQPESVSHELHEMGDTPIIEACCTLWDLSIDPTLARFMCGHQLVPLILRLIAEAEDHSDRLVEVCVGTLGNLASDAELCANLTRHTQALPLLEQLLHTSNDSSTLLELIRLINAAVCISAPNGGGSKLDSGDGCHGGCVSADNCEETSLPQDTPQVKPGVGWVARFASPAATSQILHLLLNTLRPDLMRMAASLLCTLLFYSGAAAASLHDGGTLGLLSDHIASLWRASNDLIRDETLLHVLLQLLVTLIDSLPAETEGRLCPAEVDSGASDDESPAAAPLGPPSLPPRLSSPPIASNASSTSLGVPHAQPGELAGHNVWSIMGEVVARGSRNRTTGRRKGKNGRRNRKTGRRRRKTGRRDRKKNGSRGRKKGRQNRKQRRGASGYERRLVASRRYDECHGRAADPRRPPARGQARRAALVMQQLWPEATTWPIWRRAGMVVAR